MKSKLHYALTALILFMNFGHIATCLGNPVPDPVPCQVIADAGKDKKICGQNCRFIGSNPIPGYTYSWSPSTGLNSTTDARPKASPDSTTTYVVTVTDTATGCQATDTVTVFVIPAPETDAGPDHFICEGGSVQIGTTAVPGHTYQWLPSAGLSSTTEAQPIASPTQTTTYVVIEKDSATTCRNSDTVTVYVSPNPPCSIEDISPADLICNHGNYSISTTIDPAQYNLEWTMNVDGNPDGWAIIGSNTSQTIIFSSGDCGSLGFQVHFTLKVTSKSDSTCAAICSRSFSPRAPQCVVDLRPVDSCFSGPQYLLATYHTEILNPILEWFFNGVSMGPGISDGVSLDSIFISSPGTYEFTVTDPLDSSNSCNTSVHINPLPPVDAGKDRARCPGDACKSIGSNPVPGLIYSWSPTDGLADPNASMTMAHPDSTTAYVVTVTDTVTGCQNTDTVIVYVYFTAAPDADAGPDQHICIGGSAILGSPAVAGHNYFWYPSTGLSSSTDAQPVASPSQTTTYILVEKDTSTGCQGVDTVVVYVHPVPPCTIDDISPSDLICNNGNYSISTPVDTSLYFLEWTMNVDGNPNGWSIIGANTTPTIIFSAGDCGSLGFQVHFTLKVMTKADTSCSSICSRSFAPRAAQCVVDIRPPLELNCVVTSQYLLASYQTDIVNPILAWTRNSIFIGSGISNGTNLDSILITLPGLYRFTVSDPNNQSNSCFAEVLVTQSQVPCNNDSNYCSLTQGFYGNAKGKACATGEKGDDLIYRLLGNPFGDLVIGKPGRSLNIMQFQYNCIIMRMPAGGSPQMLPLGDQTFDSSCNTTIPTNSNGRFDNVLLGQTITLGLNMRLDIELVSLELVGTNMVTQQGDAGNDDTCGTDDDVPVSGSFVTKTIPQSVLDALDSLYSNKSVGNLFDLANRSLGGQSTAGASLSDVNDAVSAINEGFDGCRFLTEFSSPIFKTSGITDMDQGGENELTIKAFPNPFTSSTIIQFESMTDAFVNVDIYDMFGAKIAHLFSGKINAHEMQNVNFNGNDQLSAGIYFFVITSENSSGGGMLLLNK